MDVLPAVIVVNSCSSFSRVGMPRGVAPHRNFSDVAKATEEPDRNLIHLNIPDPTYSALLLKFFTSSYFFC